MTAAGAPREAVVREAVAAYRIWLATLGGPNARLAPYVQESMFDLYFDVGDSAFTRLAITHEDYLEIRRLLVEVDGLRLGSEALTPFELFHRLRYRRRSAPRQTLRLGPSRPEGEADDSVPHNIRFGVEFEGVPRGPLRGPRHAHVDLSAVRRERALVFLTTHRGQVYDNAPFAAVPLVPLARPDGPALPALLTEPVGERLTLALELIGATDEGRRLLETLAPLLAAGTLQLLPLTAEILARTSNPFAVGLFEYDIPTRTRFVYVDTLGQIGEIAVTLYHELVHAADDKLIADMLAIHALQAELEKKTRDGAPDEERATLAAVIRAKVTSKTFFSERRAYTAEAAFTRALLARFPETAKYYNALERLGVLKLLYTDQWIRENYLTKRMRWIAGGSHIPLSPPRTLCPLLLEAMVED